MGSKFLITSFGFLWVFFITNAINSASPPTSQEPHIFVTFTRWENRTFSPRVYYLMLQRYALANKLLDVNNEYHQYFTDGEVHPKNPPVNIVFKSQPRRPRPTAGTTPVPDGDLLADRSALRIIHPKKGFLNLRSKGDRHEPIFSLLDPSTVVFPTVSPTDTPLHVSNFFADRIAYPSDPPPRPTPAIELGNRKEAHPEQLVSPTLFDPPKSTSSTPYFTNEDVVDTVSLTISIVKYSDWDDENAVLSPLSIKNILALLFLGSNGTTFDELAAHLKPKNPFTREDSTREMRFHAAFHSLLNFLNRGSNQNVAVNICNRIIIDKKYPVLKSYQKQSIQHYDAQSDIFDFGKQSEELMRTVNNWVSYKTKGKIPSIIDSPPSSETTLMLLNAVYFRGDWETPFIKEITQRKPFYVSPTETIDVSMMTNILTVPYVETEHFRAIGIPYKGKTVGLFVMLPTNPGVKGLKEMEKQLTLDALKEISSMKPCQVTIQIPKMRLESTGHIKDLLSSFGLSSMFDPKTANFSRMSDTPGLHVSSILHKSIFEMNEHGVSAAAATVATGDRNLDDRPILFAVNRPFSFTIMNIKARTILFFGRVTRPLPLNEG